MKIIADPRLRLLTAVAFCLLAIAAVAQKRDLYEIKIYTLTNAEQEQSVDKFLKEVYLPALHRAGIGKIGVFKPVETDTAFYGKRIYVLTTLPSLDDFEGLEAKLHKDANLVNSGYWNAAFNAPSYSRIESILLRAFVNSPKIQTPQLEGTAAQRIYELRSYESATEKLYISKVKMFNDGDEIGLFKRLNFNAVFYAEVVSGSKMPNLMYMTSFNDMTARDAHWKAFFDDPQWKKLKEVPEYQHNVSKAEIFLLHPTPYSEL